MGEVNTDYKVNIAVNDVKWQAFVKSVSELQFSFVAVTKSAIESAQKISTFAEQSAAKQISSKRQVMDVDEKAQAAMERNIAKQIQDNQKASAQIEVFIAKENAAKQKAAAAIEKQIAKESAEKEKAEKKAEALAMKQATVEEKAAQKAAAAIEKEEEKKQAYLLKLRMKSIADANKAQEKADKDAAKSHSGGGGAGSRIVHGAESGLGFGLAIEGLKVIKEKSEEAVQSQKQLQVGTGLSGKALEDAGKDAEKLGDKFAISGEVAKTTMGKVASYTNASGEELKQQTAAVIAYGQAHGKSGEMVAKLMATEKGRAKIFGESQLNIAKAEMTAQEPAANMERIQHKLTETVGKVAMVALNSLQPALQAITPILDTIGTLVEGVVKPAMDALAPIMKLLADTFTQLAPIIVDLISTGLSILMPIISDMSEVFKALIPPLIGIVKTIIEALNPVLKQLMPIINQVAGIIKDVLVQNSGMLIDVLQNVLVPVIRDLVAPILLSLMPLLKAIADLMNNLVMPAVKILSGVMQFLMVNVVQPLIKHLGGGLTAAINAVVSVVTAAVKAVNAVVGVFKDLLGLGGDDAKAATKEGGEKVLEQEKQNELVAKAQKEKDFADREKKNQEHLINQMKAGKLSAEDEADMREKASADGNEKLLLQLDAYDKKKEKQGASSAKKQKKSAVDSAKEQADELLAITKEEIAAKDITDRQAKSESRTAEMVHAQSILDISLRFYGEQSKQYQQAKLKLRQQKNADAKEDRVDRIADAKKATENQLAELELRATSENMSAKQLQKQTYKIQLEGMDAEITLVKKGSDEEAKLLQQRALMIAKHTQDTNKDVFELQDEASKLAIANQKQSLTLQLEQLKVFGKSTSIVEQQLIALEAQEENKRYAEELQKRKESGQLLVDENGKLNDLGLQSQIDHQTKLAMVVSKGANARIENMKKEAEFFAGPIAQAFTSTFKKIMKGADDWTAKMAASNNVLESVFGGILQGFVQMIEGMIEKIIAIEAVLLVANLIPGFGGLMSAIGGIGSLIPGHAEGTDNSPGGWHFVGEKGVELVNMKPGARVIPNHELPLSSRRSQGMMQSAYAFDKALSPVVSGLSRIETHVARTKVVLPMNNTFEDARNNYIKSEDRRSI